ncbi:MAG: hypothetical protein ACXWQE_00190 [Bdellovibrionales bacterium]
MESSRMFLIMALVGISLSLYFLGLFMAIGVVKMLGRGNAGLTRAFFWPLWMLLAAIEEIWNS